MDEEKDLAFYKRFYEESRIGILQDESLRKNFQRMVEDVLGKDYYNLASDVYDCDRICCEDITRKANRSLFEKMFDL